MKYCIECALGLGKHPEQSPWAQMGMRAWSKRLSENLTRLSMSDFKGMGPLGDPSFNG